MIEQQQKVYWAGTLPLDSQGFTKSFDINAFDPEEVKAFYQEFGLVVFDNILIGQEIEKTIGNIWDEIQSRGFGKIDRNNMKTWNFSFQPYLQSFGFVGRGPTDREQFWKNRSNPKIYKAFKSLFQLSSGEKITEPLLAIFDRASLLRPSKNHPEWKTEPIPHFDINPWWWTGVEKIDQQVWRRQGQYNMRFDRWLGQGCYVPKVKNFTKLQGVLALSSTNSETGGFEAICGFHRYIQLWCRNHRNNTYFGDCPDMMKHMQKVYQRAGSVLIFSRELPHGIAPNKSQNTLRYAQYLRMAPESTLMLSEFQKEMRIQRVREMLPKEYLCSKDPICRQIYMLDEKLMLQKEYSLEKEKIQKEE